MDMISDHTKAIEGINVTMQSGQDRDRVRFLVYSLLNIFDAKRFFRVKITSSTGLSIDSVLRDKRPGAITKKVVNDEGVAEVGFTHMSVEEASAIFEPDSDEAGEAGDADENL
jgi:hypothetical protein